MPLSQIPWLRHSRPHSPNDMLFPDRQNRRRPRVLTRETKRGLELAADFGLEEPGEEDGEGEDAGDDDPDVDFGDSKRS